MTTRDRFRAAFTIAIDPIDLEQGFRGLSYRTGCRRCGRERDARGPKGGLLACCTDCLELMKLYRVYGAAEAQKARSL